MAVKLRLVADAQTIENEAAKRFLTCKHNKETLWKVISTSLKVV